MQMILNKKGNINEYEDDINQNKHQYSQCLYHSIRYAMYTLRVNFPYAKCFVTTPLQRTDREQPEQLREAIIKMANRYNFIVMDAEYESGIIHDDYQMASSNTNYLFSLQDVAHPTVNGARQLAVFYSNIIIPNF